MWTETIQSFSIATSQKIGYNHHFHVRHKQLLLFSLFQCITVHETIDSMFENVDLCSRDWFRIWNRSKKQMRKEIIATEQCLCVWLVSNCEQWANEFEYSWLKCVQLVICIKLCPHGRMVHNNANFVAVFFCNLILKFRS